MKFILYVKTLQYSVTFLWRWISSVEVNFSCLVISKTWRRHCYYGVSTREIFPVITRFYSYWSWNVTYHPVHACFCTMRFVSNRREQNTAAAPAETDWWTPSSDIHPHLKYIKIIDFTLVKEILITSADSDADIKTDNLKRQSSIETFNWNKLDLKLRVFPSALIYLSLSVFLFQTVI